jgi:hypothetical protein
MSTQARRRARNSAAPMPTHRSGPLPVVAMSCNPTGFTEGDFLLRCWIEANNVRTSNRFIFRFAHVSLPILHADSVDNPLPCSTTCWLVCTGPGRDLYGPTLAPFSGACQFFVRIAILYKTHSCVHSIACTHYIQIRLEPILTILPG